MMKKMGCWLICLLLLTGQMSTFANVTEIIETKESVRSMAIELTEGDEADLFLKIETVLNNTLISKAMDTNSRQTLDQLHLMMSESVKRFDSVRAAQLVEQYSRVLTAYFHQPDLTRSDIQVLTDKFIQLLGNDVLMIEGINQERIKVSLRTVVNENMHLQGQYSIGTSPAITLSQINAVLLQAEKAYRITTIDVNEYERFKNIANDLQRELILVGDDTVHVTLVADAVKVLVDKNYKLTIVQGDARYGVSTETLAKIQGDLPITITPVVLDPNKEYGYAVTDGKLKPLSLYNVSIGNIANKDMITLHLSVVEASDPNMPKDYFTLALSEDNQWTKIVYSQKNGIISVEIPQNAVYGMMSYSPTYIDLVGHWSESNIKTLLAKGIFESQNTSNFYPNNIMTRGEFVEALVDVMGANGTSDNVFTDVLPGSPYEDMIGSAIYYGFTVGSSNNKFYPNDPLTREDMVTLVAHLYELQNGYALEGGFLDFKDLYTISAYARESVKVMQEAGFISGYPDNTFRPKVTVAKSVAAAVLNKVLK